MRDPLEELRHPPARDLRVGTGDERRRIDEVDEQNGCELSFHEPKSMNDRAAVKSPENPGFKPKKLGWCRPAASRTLVVVRAHAMRLKQLRFEQKHRKTDEKRRKLRDPNLTAATYGVNLPRLSG
jgi:hypothetical protein